MRQLRDAKIAFAFVNNLFSVRLCIFRIIYLNVCLLSSEIIVLSSEEEDEEHHRSQENTNLRRSARLQEALSEMNEIIDNDDSENGTSTGISDDVSTFLNIVADCNLQYKLLDYLSAKLSIYCENVICNTNTESDPLMLIFLALRQRQYSYSYD